MLKRLLQKLLGGGHHTPHYGRKPYHPLRSSDDYPKHRHYPSNHNQYGHGYYKKKHGSSSYSS